MWQNVINLFKKDNLYQQALQQAYAMLTPIGSCMRRRWSRCSLTRAK